MSARLVRVMRVLALLSAGTGACDRPPAPRDARAEPKPSAGNEANIESVCASPTPQSDLPCAAGTYCTRAPAGGANGVHCGCVEGRTRCQPVFAHPPDGACESAKHEDVLVAEGGGVMGWSCLCPTGPNAHWICSPPPPGGPLMPPDLQSS